MAWRKGPLRGHVAGGWSGLAAAAILVHALLAVGFAVEGMAASLPRGRAAPVSHLRACPFAIPDSVAAPTYVLQQEMSEDNDDSSDDEDDDEDDDDEDEEDDDEDDSSPPKPLPGPGYMAGDGCIFVGAEIYANTQAGRVGGQVARGRGRDLPVTTYSPKSTFKLRQLTPTAYGDLVTRFLMDVVPGQATINEASIAFGPLVAGMETSFFDAWTADEFTFRALSPSQSPTILGWTYRPNTNVSLSVSLEDQTFRRVTISGYAGQSLPDIVAQARYTNDTFDIRLSGAARETRLTNDPSGTIHGFAALASVQYTLPIGDGDSYVIAQGTWADKAPGYLGINTTNSNFQLPVSGILSADVAERARGWNAALVGYWQISPTWSSAAFVSRVGVEVPGAVSRNGGTAGYAAWRSAINISWQPVSNFSITLEAGRSRLESQILLLPASHTTTLILSIQRTF